ncbi:hypothetical protein ACFFMR_22640 [Micromonospora andamanensis]|uniref:hypothetical protein n=1 Tax=Micromonospora andamanensis TaxID=1287068 RepID=UPI0019529B00|nr:hypothetical protein [Micromonospora andamanensis]
MLTATRSLLTTLDPLPYPVRMSRLVEWARTAPDRVQVCRDLREQGPYARHLALVAAMATRDAEGIAAAARDPQPSIRGAALTAALRADIPIGDVTDRSAMQRRRVYRSLRRRCAPAVADALISEVRAQFGDEEAATLLPACGDDTVRALLPDLEHALRLERLARRHEGPLLERIRERLAAAPPEPRARIWGDAAVAVLRCDPTQALDLLERYAPEESLPGPLDAYGRLAAHDPVRVARLLTTPGRAAWLRRNVLPPALLRRLAVLPTDELVPLASRYREHSRALAALLDAVAPARRADLYDRALSEVDTAMLIPAAEIMEVLPAEVRIREARRVLGLARIQEREAEVRLWSAYLAWPDASAAHALGKRAWRLPQLQDLLRRAIGPHTLASVARTAIGLWLDDPRTRSDRVAEVLATDPTAVTLHEVWVIICASRTDLLDQVLKRRPRGRFVEPGIRWVPAWVPHAERWLPRQQTRFVEHLELILADTEQGVWQRAAAIRAAAHVPGAGRELVLRHLDAPAVAIAEAALGALVWTDRPGEDHEPERGRPAPGTPRTAAGHGDPARHVSPPGRAPRPTRGDRRRRPAASTGPGELDHPAGRGRR